MTKFTAHFNDFMMDKGLTPDPVQKALAAELETLENKLNAPAKKGLFSKKQTPVKGLYIWGGVGRGKTMVMDSFFDHITITHKKRVHFNIFMLDVHAAVQAMRQDGETEDPLPKIAHDIAKTCRLLCFDEFQVYDIADAMILARLFETLFENDVTVIATSNVAPDDLYKNGLQRARFIPFIEVLKKHVKVFHMANQTDYRQQALHDDGTYFIQNEKQMRQVFERFVGDESPKPACLNVNGRDLPVELQAGRSGWFSFAELCEKPRAAVDYALLTQTFETVFINDVPRMGYDRRNEAKRFVLLIDTLYDAGLQVVINAETPPQKLYFGDHHAFEFERTISRLLEMQGDDWPPLRSQE